MKERTVDVLIAIGSTLLIWSVGLTGLCQRIRFAVVYHIGCGVVDWVAGAAVVLLMFAYPVAMWLLLTEKYKENS